MNCVSENNLRAYHDAELGAVQDSEIEAHLAGCAECTKRLSEIAATAARVEKQMVSLGASSAEMKIDAQAALARFKAQQGAGVETMPSKPDFVADETNVRARGRRWRPLWIGAVAATILLCSLVFPFGRGLAQRLLGTLRVEKVQPVRLDFSALDGNRPLQEMLRQMISDKVVVTADEKPQPASSAADAGQLAGFSAHVLGARTDAPKFIVGGQHAFHMTIGRTRLYGHVTRWSSTTPTACR